MAQPLAPWLAVHPSDYLAASQAGANVGLSIARLRQAADDRNLRLRADSEEKAADRQASADRLRQQLQQQRESKMADMELARERESQDLLQSQAGLDMQRAGLDFRKAQEGFQEEQAQNKLRLAADSSDQEGNLLRDLARDSSPKSIQNAAARNPLAKSAFGAMNHGLTLEAQEKTRTEEITNPRPTAAMRDTQAGSAKIQSWINNGPRMDLIEGAKLLGLSEDSVIGKKKDLTPNEENSIISKVQSLILLRQKAETPEKQKEIDGMIGDWRKKYPDLFGGGPPSLPMNPKSGPSLPSTNAPTRLRWTPQGLQPIQ